MNQPTEDRIKNIEKKQEDFDKRLTTVEGRQTEPIPATTRIEVASADVLNQLKALEEGQQELKRILLDQTIKKLDSVQEDTNTVKIEMQGVRADISSLQATQSDHSAFFIEHGQHLKAIKDDQDRHTETLGSLISSAESHDTLLKNTATKDDIAELKDLILNLLPKPPES